MFLVFQKIKTRCWIRTHLHQDRTSDSSGKSEKRKEGGGKRKETWGGRFEKMWQTKPKKYELFIDLLASRSTGVMEEEEEQEGGGGGGNQCHRLGCGSSVRLGGGRANPDMERLPSGFFHTCWVRPSGALRRLLGRFPCRCVVPSSRRGAVGFSLWLLGPRAPSIQSDRPQTAAHSLPAR